MEIFTWSKIFLSQVHAIMIKRVSKITPMTLQRTTALSRQWRRSAGTGNFSHVHTRRSKKRSLTRAQTYPGSGSQLPTSSLRRFEIQISCVSSHDQPVSRSSDRAQLRASAGAAHSSGETLLSPSPNAQKAGAGLEAIEKEV